MTSSLDAAELAYETGDKEVFQKATNETVENCKNLTDEAKKLKLLEHHEQLQNLMDDLVLKGQQLEFDINSPITPPSSPRGPTSPTTAAPAPEKPRAETSTPPTYLPTYIN